MDKDSLRLVDRTFAHSKLGYCSDYQISDKFVWDRATPLNECKIQNKFSKILTHEKSLVDLGEPYEFIPFGCCWIPNEEHMIYNKTKNISIIASNKAMTDGHQKRHTVIETFKDKIDVYGRGWNPVEHKVDALAPYRFSIVIENCSRDGWFTEKLIDCFATGTIPIYWGAPDIGDYFNTTGILKFNTINELTNILENTTQDNYNLVLESIEDNLERSKNYLLPDNWVLTKVKG